MTAGNRLGGWGRLTAARPGRAAAAVAVVCWAISGSVPSAVVTQTYDAVWLADYNTQVPGPAADVPLADVIRQRVTPGDWGRPGRDVRADGVHRATVTAPTATQAAVARLIADHAVEVSIETRVFTVTPAQRLAAGIGPLVPGQPRPLTEGQLSALILAVNWNDDEQYFGVPRLTLSNGQGIKLAYTQARSPTGAEQRFRCGVRGVISADRHSIDLTARVELVRVAGPSAVTPVGDDGRPPRGTGGRTWSVDAATRLPSGGIVAVRGTPTVRQAGGPATAPADGTQTIVIWKAVVLQPGPRPRPARRWWGIPDGWLP